MEILPKSIFSPEQDYAFEKFCNGENIFISGAGGSGKSFLIKHFVRHLITKTPMKKFQVTSTTGCSSVLLSENIQNTHEYGKMVSVKTIHSWSGMRFCKGDDSKIIKSILNNHFVSAEWKKINVLIVDEVSMLSFKMFNILEKVARIFRKNCLPFGGIQLVFLGDMYQLAPVPDSDDPMGDSSKFCFESSLWNFVFPIDNHIELKTIFRQTDTQFKEILGEIRTGQLSVKNANILKTFVGRKIQDEDENGENIIPPPKIFSVRSKVDYVNNSQYENITEEEHIYEYQIFTKYKTYVDSEKPISKEDLLACSNLTPQQIEYELNQMKKNIAPPEILKLKKGCPVMCLSNIDIESGICNGSLGIVVDFVVHTSNPIVQFKNGVRLTIDPHTWQNTDYPILCIQQYPLCLSFANTIHKLQGATLDMATMDLGMSIFTEGQIYVALSRVKSLEGLYLLAFHPNKIRVNPKVTAFYSQFPLVEFVYEDEC
jgi:ATP-dependent DNA helicase PIF1